jgi:hypothetical protein
VSRRTARKRRARASPGARRVAQGTPATPRPPLTCTEQPSATAPGLSPPPNAGVLRRRACAAPACPATARSARSRAIVHGGVDNALCVEKRESPSIRLKPARPVGASLQQIETELPIGVRSLTLWTGNQQPTHAKQAPAPPGSAAAQSRCAAPEQSQQRRRRRRRDLRSARASVTRRSACRRPDPRAPASTPDCRSRERAGASAGRPTALRLDDQHRPERRIVRLPFRQAKHQPRLARLGVHSALVD